MERAFSPDRLCRWRATILIVFVVIYISSYLYTKSIPGYQGLADRYPPLHEIDGADKMKKILYWTSWFGDVDWTHRFNSFKQMVAGCSPQCVLSTDRRAPLRYDALIFHGRDPQWPPRERRASQVYIMSMLESPVNRGGGFVVAPNFYNWTITYAHKSDFYMPYWSVLRRRAGDAGGCAVPLPQMSRRRKPGEAMVAWIVSHCRTESRREQYVELLAKHIKVDVFGSCGEPCKNASCIQALAESGQYKFYLSFENSACRDYITEKAAGPLRVGLVPVVYGGLSAEDYVRKMPASSYIDVRNFSSPERLADHLRYLDETDAAYLSYHAWRAEYVFGVDGAEICDVCRALHNATVANRRTVNWAAFWDPDSECDAGFFDTVKGKVSN